MSFIQSTAGGVGVVSGGWAMWAAGKPGLGLFELRIWLAWGKCWAASVAGPFER
jgi:hypothetical protein